MRYSILFFVILAGIGPYYASEMPALVYKQLIEEFMKIMSATQAEYLYGLLFTIYNLPNIFLPLFCGYISDKIGMGNVSVILLGFVAFGQMLFTYGLSTFSSINMILGRFLTGVGGEFVNISAATFCYKWFKGKEFSFSSSLFVSLMRIVSITNALTTPVIAKKKGLVPASMFASFLTLFSFIAGTILRYLDKKHEDKCPHKEEPTSLTLRQFFQALGKLDSIFWLLLILTSFFYLNVIAYIIFASRIIIEEWLPGRDIKDAQEIAGFILTSLYITCFITLPIFGHFVDKFGQRVRFLTLTSVLSLVSHIMFLKIYPIIPFIILGISFSSASAITFPTLAFLIPSKLLGFGYGILTIAINIGIGLMPIIIVGIKSIYPTNLTIHIIFIFTSSISIILMILFIHMDNKRELSLNSPDQEALHSLIKEEYSSMNINQEDDEKDDVSERSSLVAFY